MGIVLDSRVVLGEIVERRCIADVTAPPRKRFLSLQQTIPAATIAHMADTCAADRSAPSQRPADDVAASVNDGKIHLLLAATGSVATIKLPNIISSLSKHPNLSIRVILTKAAARFLTQTLEKPSLTSIASLPNVDSVYEDEHEWVTPWSRGTEILHITLRRWAHMMVIAPLSANTLAKVVNGISDTLLTSVIRAWDTTGTIDGKKSRIIVAPAMNTAMWVHPITAQQVRVLEEDWGVKTINAKDEESGVAQQGWFEVLRPIDKTLACGDVGTGAMLEWTEIVKIIENRLSLSS